MGEVEFDGGGFVGAGLGPKPGCHPGQDGLKLLLQLHGQVASGARASARVPNSQREVGSIRGIVHGQTAGIGGFGNEKINVVALGFDYGMPVTDRRVQKGGP